MDLSSKPTPWPVAADSKEEHLPKVKCVILGAEVGAASPGAAPGEDMGDALWPAPHRVQWDESYSQGQKLCLLSVWPWTHLALCCELVFVTSTQGRITVPGLELETLNLSLPLAGCLTFVQTGSFWD